MTRPLAISASIVLLDQLSKALVRRIFPVGDFVQVIPGVFNIGHVQNTGAAWGIMSGMRIGLVAFSIAMLAALIVFRRKIFPESAAGAWCLGLLCGGIAGNLIDRALLGHVVDFLDFHWGIHHFPSFNVADSAICIGAGLFMIISWIADSRAQAAEK